MSKPIIEVENIGKRYHLGLQNQAYATLRGVLTDAMAAPWRRLVQGGEDRGAEDTFWAIRGISFQVQRGEVTGIIGSNGAGKSTLLKVLSRITEPTEGRAILRGRVASLLEVGTGFHPELTGRENIYLNGSILGMKRAEINARFDQIVAFAEIEKFLDTPVKRYSSGMYVRLAFAVAAHLEPEILIVDEVLAVGDGEFQKKCLGKMKDVAAGHGRTVLFVSHNMAAIRSLCDSCCVLERGRLTIQGDTEQCVSDYLARTSDGGLKCVASFQRPDNAPLWMTGAQLLCDGSPSATLRMGEQLSVAVHIASETPLQHPRLGIVMATQDGERLINISSRYQPCGQFSPPVQAGVIHCHLGVVPLVAKRYFLTLYLGNPVHDTHIQENALSFEVIEQDIWGMGKTPSARSSLLWWPARYQLVGVP